MPSSSCCSVHLVVMNIVLPDMKFTSATQSPVVFCAEEESCCLLKIPDTPPMDGPYSHTVKPM